MSARQSKVSPFSHYHLIRLIYDRCYRLLCVVYQSSKGSVSPPTDNTSKLQKENICTIKIFLCMRHYLSDCRARDKSGVLALGAVYNTTRSAWLTTAFITYLLLLLFLSFRTQLPSCYRKQELLLLGLKEKQE